jgi:surface antigen
MATINELCEGLELQKPGTTWRWENPKTGHSGRVTLIKAFQFEGKSCRVLKHHVNAGTDEPWVTQFTTCQNAEGHWVLRPDIKAPDSGEREIVK